MSDAIRERIQARLDATGKKPRAASLEAGMSADAIRGIFRNLDSSPTVETLTKLAVPLVTTPEWLAFGVDPAVTSAMQATAASAGSLMRVAGEVAAGRWLEIDEHVDESRYDPVPITADGAWPEHAQYGLVVRGTSINKFAIDGDTLHCVDLAETGLQPQNGDLVVVERIQAGGHLRERTAKRYYLGEQAMAQLRPDSDDPKWQEPIDLPYRVTSWEDGEGLRLEIKAVVVGSYRPVQRRAR